MSVAISSHYHNEMARPTIAERRHLVKILPTSTVPTQGNPVPAGSVIEFLNLPSSTAAAGSFISVKESYMELTVRCINAANNTPAALPRQGAASLFERIQVHSSGMVVEDSLHHNQLISLLSDMTNMDQFKAGVPALLEGLGSDAGPAPR